MRQNCVRAEEPSGARSTKASREGPLSSTKRRNSDKVRSPSVTSSLAPAAGQGRLVAALARLKRPIVAIAAVGTVLGGLAGYWNSYRAVRTTVLPSATDVAIPAAAEKPASAADRRMTFAVLPFTSPTGDAQGSRLAVEAFEATQTQQEARTNWARVAPRPLVERTVATPRSIRELGESLSVHFLLRGNVTRSAGGYAVDLTVLDAADEHPLASRSIPAAGSLSEPNVPSRGIDNALSALTFAALKREVARARDKPDNRLDTLDWTYRAYVDASAEDPDRPAAYAAGQRSLQRALALTPDDPLALRITAELNLCECLRTWAADTREMERIGEAALEKGLAIRPESPGLLGLRGWLLLKRGRNEDALLIANQLLARTPDDPELLRQRVIALYKLGQIEQALATVPAMLAANDAWWVQANAATVLYAAGDDAASILSARKALLQMSASERADPMYGVVALVLVAAEVRTGRLDRARTALKDFQDAVPKAQSISAIKAWRPPYAMLPDTAAFWQALTQAGLNS
ncbi:MAG: tetratricopeptide repeat protein [Salinibacterium sp.]|nr:tetratricopeptide repeat protein [Salinibacterium sp.]